MSRFPAISRLIDKAAAYQGINASLCGLRYRLHDWLGHGEPPRRRHAFAPPDGNFKDISFTFAVIALSAHVARADGSVSRAKYIAFRDAFPLKGHLCSKIRNLFTLACHNTTPADHYVAQISALFPQHHELHRCIMERLAAIAAADGGISSAAERLLAALARALRLSPAEYGEIIARQGELSRARQLLGLSRHASDGTVKKRYRELMRRYHPDRFAGQELSPDLDLLLRLKSAEINEAYRALRHRAA